MVSGPHGSSTTFVRTTQGRSWKEEPSLAPPGPPGPCPLNYECLEKLHPTKTNFFLAFYAKAKVQALLLLRGALLEGQTSHSDFEGNRGGCSFDSSLPFLGLVQLRCAFRLAPFFFSTPAAQNHQVRQASLQMEGGSTELLDRAIEKSQFRIQISIFWLTVWNDVEYFWPTNSEHQDRSAHVLHPDVGDQYGSLPRTELSTGCEPNLILPQSKPTYSSRARMKIERQLKILSSDKLHLLSCLKIM